MTCKDCLYVEICKKTRIMNPSRNYATECKDFKDRSRFVELPYDLEQTVFVLDFFIDKKHGQIVKKAFIHSYSYAKQYGKVISLMVKEDEVKSTFKSYKLTDFGETVFLTREEAEKALKESKKDE